MTNQLQKLATMHGALVQEIMPLAAKFADALALLEAMGHQINAALASSDGATYTTLDEWAVDNLGCGPDPVPETTVHAPSTIPPPVETDEIGAIAHSAEFAPDHEPPGVELPAAKPKRAKTEYTAKEWGNSIHFLHLMKRQAPFRDWPVAEQNAKRDEFVESVPVDECMNRWGQRFAKFCGVST